MVSAQGDIGMMGSVWFVVLVGLLSFIAGCWLRPQVGKWLTKG